LGKKETSDRNKGNEKLVGDGEDWAFCLEGGGAIAETRYAAVVGHSQPETK